MSGEWLRRAKGRAQRRGFGIHAYVGLNGSGKSLAMVWDTLPSLDSGRSVLSTVRLLDYRHPRPCDDDACTDWQHPDHGAAHPCWVPFRSWDQLLAARDCDVLMDEVTGIASSRSSGALPGAVEVHLQQLRRRNVTLRWTAPAWARADVIVRECTQAVTQCRGMWAAAPGSDGQGRLWRPRRLFRWKTYDRLDFSEFSDGTRQDLRALVRDWHYGPGSAAFSAYDTLDDVLMVGTVTDSGRCVVCGGRRTVPMCTCGDGRRERRRRDPAGGPGGVVADAVPDPPAPVVTVPVPVVPGVSTGPGRHGR